MGLPAEKQPFTRADCLAWKKEQTKRPLLHSYDAVVQVTLASVGLILSVNSFFEDVDFDTA